MSLRNPSVAIAQAAAEVVLELRPYRIDHSPLVDWQWAVGHGMRSAVHTGLAFPAFDRDAAVR